MFSRRLLSASLRGLPSRVPNVHSAASFARLQRTSATSIRMFSSTGSDSTPSVPEVPVVPSTPSVPDISPESAQAAIEAIGADAVRELGYTPVDLVIKGIEQVHLLSGMPYWATIIALTIGIRLALLPVAVKTQQAAVRLQKIKPDLDRLTNAVKNADTSDASVRMRYNEEIRHLMASNKVNPLKALVMPFFQIPIFLSFFFGLQQIGTYVPAYATGGMYWFTDLGAADPTLILPAINALSFLGIVELGAETQMSNPYMKNFMRLMGLVMVPVTMNMPQVKYFSVDIDPNSPLVRDCFSTGLRAMLYPWCKWQHSEIKPSQKCSILNAPLSLPMLHRPLVPWSY